MLGASIFAMFFLLALYMQEAAGPRLLAIRSGLGYLLAGLHDHRLGRHARRRSWRGSACARAARRHGAADDRAALLHAASRRTARYLGDLAPGFVLAGIGLGFAFVPVTIAALMGISDDEAGLASGLINTSQQIGGAVGVALLATVFTSRYGRSARERCRRTTSATPTASRARSSSARVMAGIGLDRDAGADPAEPRRGRRGARDAERIGAPPGAARRVGRHDCGCNNGCDDEARRHPPRHGDHGRRPAQRRLLRPRARPADGQEDGQPGRSVASTTCSTPTRTAPPAPTSRSSSTPGAPRGRAGAGMVHRVVFARRLGRAALDFWEERLGGEGVASRARRAGSRFCRPRGPRARAAGRRHARRAARGRPPRDPGRAALQGFDSVRAYAHATPSAAARCSSRCWSFAPTGDASGRRAARARRTYAIDVAGRAGIPGAGTVHHVAWASPMDEHDAWASACAPTRACTRRR